MVSRGILWVAAVLLMMGAAAVALAVRATTDERPLGPGVVLLERATPLPTAAGSGGPTSPPGLQTVQPAPAQPVDTDDDDESEPAGPR